MRDANEPIPALWANIPAAVLFNKQLRPNAKLIYGVISSLATANGYCFASNAYLAALFDLTPKSVSEIISQLAAKGFIYVEMVEELAGKVGGRRIWICGDRLGMQTPPAHTPPKNREGNPPEKSGGGIPKNREHINNNYNNTPYNPPEGGARGRLENAQRDAETFEEFWTAYPRKIDKQRAYKAWRRLNVSDEELDLILRAIEAQKKSPQWTKDGGTFVPHPTTWLNNRRWEAELPTSSGSTDPPRGRMRGVEDW